MIIRFDAIGDYILFRNFIEVLKKSEKYRDYKITLLGNNAWKSLSKELDSEFVDEFIWLDRNKFHKDFLYRYKKLKEITACGYEVVMLKKHLDLGPPICPKDMEGMEETGEWDVIA